MLFEWNRDTIRWQLNAAEYTAYPQKMAALLLEKIPVRGSLCDMGCGMALVDFELAPRFERITCADVNDNALAFVRERTEALGVGNLTAVRSDGKALEGEWDTVMALFHGEVETVCTEYLKKARDRLVVVTHGTHYGSTGPRAYWDFKRDNTDFLTLWLEEHGYTFTREDGALEFGQPHRSFEDAVASTAAFCPHAPLDAVRESVRAAVQETGRADFPLYTPKTRRFTVFVIPRAENARLL